MSMRAIPEPERWAPDVEDTHFSVTGMAVEDPHLNTAQRYLNDNASRWHMTDDQRRDALAAIDVLRNLPGRSGYALVRIMSDRGMDS